jgi:hypothetical protein
MAEERSLGLARATQHLGAEESKEEIQRRMELARDSISHTVTEIKETVAHQVQAVKDTLDWREQFRRRPVAWSAGALGVGFVAGYSLAGVFKHDERYSDYSAPSTFGYSSSRAHRLTPQATAGAQMPDLSESFAATPPKSEEEDPGLIEKFKESSAYESLSKEASSLGNKLIEELSSTAHLVVLPFLISKFKEMVGLDRLENSQGRGAGTSARHEAFREPTRRRETMTEN